MSRTFEVRLLPVSSGSGENKEFYRWTPGGEIPLLTLNTAVGEALEIGKECYVDFTKAE